ncbi:MAG: hypothetical protein L0Z62_20300 [Gemmataceae bacterium]|nr:hypothetical protein [Gemmataceae bacterium]
MRLTCGRKCWLGLLGTLIITTAGVAFWLVAIRPSTPPERISRSFTAAGVKKVVLRAAAADTAEVTADSAAGVVEVSGVPAGGASGYHSPDPNWRETPAAEWGLDFVCAQYGEVLVISTKNEIHYIHHGYFLQSLTLRVPARVEVVKESRKLAGNGAPDLEEPGP